jgi:hypothetical protein
LGKFDPVITHTQAARLHAQAWADTSGKSIDQINKDPSGALTPGVRNSFGIHAQAKLIDLELYSDDLGDIDFGSYSPADLQSIYTTGADSLGNSVTMQPSLWITPSGTITPIGPQISPPAISLSDWARIYAYIWYQVNFASPKNTTIKANFENDPAKALSTQIIAPLNTASPTLPPINYNYKTTPLVTHGAPPLAFATNFPAISNDPNAKGYRYIVRYCC